MERLSFLQDLLGVSLHFDFFWSDDAGHCALGIRDKGGAVHAHVCASGHLFLAIYTEFLHEFEFCVAEKWERKIVLVLSVPIPTDSLNK